MNRLLGEMRLQPSPSTAALVVFACLVVAGLAAPSISASALSSGPRPQSSGYFENPIVEGTTDPDGDGLIDAIVLTVPVVVNNSANWRIRGDLAVDQTWAADYEDAMLAPGQYSFNLSFDARRVRLGHVNGSYTVVLQLLDLDSHPPLYVGRNYTTAPYTWTSFEILAELVAGLSDRAVDADSDGLYNYLEVTGRLVVGVPAKYSLVVELWNFANTTPITSTWNTTAYAEGTTMYRVLLNGDAIRSMGLDGPYSLNVQLRDTVAAGDLLMGLWTRTAAYSAPQFYHRPIAFNGTPNDAGVDLNGDGKFDVVRIGLPVSVSVAGTYYAWGFLSGGSFGGDIFGSKSVTLPAGPSTIEVDFDGFQIRKKYVDGPMLAELYVDEGATSFRIATTYTTGTYHWQDFGNPYGRLLGVTVLPIDADSDGEYEEIRMGTTIEAFANATFVVAFYVHMGPATWDEVRPQVTGGPGLLAVGISVPAWQLHTYQHNGTYVFVVGLWSGGDPLEGLTQNATFTWDQFQPAIRLRGAVGFTPLDLDGDGKVNQVVMRVPVRVAVAGVYSLALWNDIPYAFLDGRYRYLESGDSEVVFRMSGYVLGAQTTDLSLRIQAQTIAGGRSYDVLSWTGTFPIPNPGIYQSALTTLVNLRFLAPVPLICCINVEIVNETNAYLVLPRESGGDPSNMSVLLPAGNYTMFAAGSTSRSKVYTAILRFAVPLPDGLNVTLRPEEPVADRATIEFRNWTSARGWGNRSLPAASGWRFQADLLYDFDGTLIEGDVENIFLAISNYAGSSVRLKVDGRDFVGTSAGPPTFAGAGPVLSDAPLLGSGPVDLAPEPLTASATLSTHTVVLNLTTFWDDIRVDAIVRSPPGWVFRPGEWGPGVNVAGSGREVRVNITDVGRGTWEVDLTWRAVGGETTGSSLTPLAFLVVSSLVGGFLAVCVAVIVVIPWLGRRKVGPPRTP